MVSLNGIQDLKFKQNKSLPKCSKEIPLCVHLKGSYTLEAAVIIPLIAGFWMCMMLFFRILQIQTAVEQSLDYAGRMTAVESSLVESETGLLVSAEALFINEIKSYYVVDKYVMGGVFGISLLESDLSGDILKYKVVYRVRLPVAFFSIRSVGVEQNSAHRKWTGKNINSSEDDDGLYVYVAETGTVYHTSRSCTYLDLSIHSAQMPEISSLRNKNGEKYSACSCIAENNFEDNGQNGVYITDYGNRYHSSLTCSGIKRTVYVVKKSEAGSKGCCSKCGNDH